MRILVTAGPTREFFDSVRFISNPSTGRMGYAITVEAIQRGHQVILVSGPVTQPRPDGAEVIDVVSAKEMFEAATLRFDGCDAAILTGAVCDYRPAQRLTNKLKKDNRPRTMELQPTEDICAYLGKRKGGRVLIGFAMEDHNHRPHAEAKLRRKRCDAMILNGIENVASETAEIEIFRADRGWSGPVSGSKAEIAATVMDLVESLVVGLSDSHPKV